MSEKAIRVRMALTGACRISAPSDEGRNGEMTRREVRATAMRIARKWRGLQSLSVIRNQTFDRLYKKVTIIIRLSPEFTPMPVVHPQITTEEMPTSTNTAPW